MAQNSGGWKPYDGYNGRSMSQILNKIKAERSEEPERRQESVPERVAVQRPFENMVKDPGPVKMEPLKTLKVIESFNETDTGRRIFLLENGQYVYENGMPVSGQAGSPFKDDNRASINILNLGRELEAMEQRRQLQEQKDRAMEDMRRQADRARSRAKKSWKDDMRDKAIQAQREKQAREKEQAAIEKIMAPITPKPAAAPKKSAAPLAPAGKFNRKIDWKE